MPAAKTLHEDLLLLSGAEFGNSGHNAPPTAPTPHKHCDTLSCDSWGRRRTPLGVLCFVPRSTRSISTDDKSSTPSPPEPRNKPGSDEASHPQGSQVRIRHSTAPQHDLAILELVNSRSRSASPTPGSRGCGRMSRSSLSRRAPRRTSARRVVSTWERCHVISRCSLFSTGLRATCGRTSSADPALDTPDHPVRNAPHDITVSSEAHVKLVLQLRKELSLVVSVGGSVWWRPRQSDQARMSSAIGAKAAQALSFVTSRLP